MPKELVFQMPHHPTARNWFLQAYAHAQKPVVTAGHSGGGSIGWACRRGSRLPLSFEQVVSDFRLAVPCLG
jgi:hypothetical protein